MSTIKALAQVVEDLVVNHYNDEESEPLLAKLRDIIAVESAGARLAPTGTLQMDQVRELMFEAVCRAVEEKILYTTKVPNIDVVDLILKEHNL